MKHLYIVTFERHLDCRIDNIVYYTYASNAKEAAQIARDTWEHEHRTARKVPHMFNRHAVRSRTDEPIVHNWKGNELRKAQLIDAFVMTDTFTWRYKGSDGQYHYPKMR